MKKYNFYRAALAALFFCSTTVVSAQDKIFEKYPYPSESKIQRTGDSVFRKLSTREKIGQIMIIEFSSADSKKRQQIQRRLIKNEKIGDMTADVVIHFFESFASSAKVNIYGTVEGANDHHKAEAIFKAFAKSIKEAVKVEHDQIPSTKGVL